MAKITLRQLIKAGACREQRAKFTWRFGRSVIVTPELAIDNAGVFDWDWAAERLLSAFARAEYEKVCAPAGAECEKVCAPAGAEYEKVCASAWAEYEKVRASARAEYEKVCAPAWAEYEKVCAPTFASLYNRDHEGEE